MVLTIKDHPSLPHNNVCFEDNPKSCLCKMPNRRGNIQSHGHLLVQIRCATKYGSIPQYLLEFSDSLSE